MHLEWGLTGLREGGRLADAVVVVDVLSFCTAVAVAVERGVEVYPHRSADAYAPKVATRLGARLEDDGLTWVAGLAAGLAAGEKVVLPSRTGGALCLEAAATGTTVVAGCLRNASAVGSWIARRAGRAVVVAAGERWREGSPRWAVEDLLGAGAILAALPDDGISAEARVAAAAFRASRDDLAEILRTCTSGRLARDTAVAAQVDASPVVPVLIDGAFRPAATP